MTMVENLIERTEAWLHEDAFTWFEDDPDAVGEELIMAWTSEERAPTHAQAVALAKHWIDNPDYLLPLKSMVPGLYWILKKFAAPKSRTETSQRGHFFIR